MKKIILCSILLLVGSVAHAKVLYLSVGTLAYNLNQMSAAEDSTPSKIGAVYPTAGFSLVPKLTEGLYFYYDFDFTIFGRKLANDSGKTRVINQAATLGVRFNNFTIRTGPGLMIYQISGAGGTVDLDNGVTTSTFANPSVSRSGRSFFWDLGFSVGGEVGFRFDVDAHVIQLLEADRRALSVMARLSYGLL